MRTIRGRLTLGYGIAIGVSLVGLAGALMVERRASALHELDRRLELEADLAVQFLAQSYLVLGRVVREAPAAVAPVDPLGDSLPPPPRYTLEPGVSAYLEGVRDPLVVADRSGQWLALTASARGLSYDLISRLLEALQPLPPGPRSATLPAGPPTGALRYHVQPVPDDGSGVGAVVVAAPTRDVPFGPGDLLRSFLLVAPVVLLGSLVLGYWLAGLGLRPLQQMADELEAITDGRSLHRRLAVPATGDEVSRLGTTVNGMLARLERSFASLRRFTADASHELKTPLMVLRAGVERALTHPGAPAESLEALDETLEQINQMSEMVDGLLTLARADEGRAPLALEPTDLRLLVADAAETAEILSESAGVTVGVAVPATAVVVPVDASRIRQLLLNLVTNAVKYTPPGGEVALALEERGDDVTITVRDSGVGIAAGDLPHIFDRFWRADPSRARTGERAGSGLGLAITQWIAEAHGGSIAVQSRPNRGTTFTVLLPRAEPLPSGSGPSSR